MEQHTEVIADRYGNVLPRVPVLIKTEAGAIASLFAYSGGAAIANPVIADTNGRITFAAANGTYSGITQSPNFAPTEIPEFTLFDPADNPNLSKDALAASDGTELVGGTWFGGVVSKLSTLAAAVGATLIGFSQAGAGAVPRSVAAELQDRVSVKQFGAKGDGVTDDTAAIQSALTFGAGRCVEFPAGTYMTRGNHTIPRNTVLKADGWNCSVKLIDNSNPVHMFKGGDESAVTTIQFSNIKLDGNKANNTSGHGIHLIRPLDANMHHVYVRNFAGDCVIYEAEGTSFGNYIYDSWIYGSGGVNFRMNGNITDTHLIGCDIGYAVSAGVVLASSCSVVDSVVWGAGMATSNGIYTAGVGWQIIGCKIEGHGKHGVYIPAGNHYGLISGCKIYANSWNVATSNQYDGIYVEAGSNYGTIVSTKVYSAVTAQNQYNTRYAIAFAGAHETWTIHGNDLIAIGAGGVLSTGKIVQGLLDTDKFDGNWIRTNVKARRSASAAAAAANAWTAFPYDQEDADTIAEFSNGTFTPKNSGRYRIEAAFTCTPAAAGENLGLALYTNAGVGVRRMAFFRSEGTNSEMVSGSIDEFLTAGTAYDLRYLVGSTSTQFLAGGDFTFARIRAVPN